MLESLWYVIRMQLPSVGLPVAFFSGRSRYMAVSMPPGGSIRSAMIRAFTFRASSCWPWTWPRVRMASSATVSLPLSDCTSSGVNSGISSIQLSSFGPSSRCLVSMFSCSSCVVFGAVSAAAVRRAFGEGCMGGAGGMLGGSGPNRRPSCRTGGSVSGGRTPSL